MSPNFTERSSPPSDFRHWWNRTRYQLYAPIYDWVARPMEKGRKRAIEQIAPGSDERILIVGCGPGSDLPYLPSDASITAVDAAPAMIRRTRERADTLGMEVNAHVGDAQALPVEEDSFDVVLLHLILTVVPDPEAVAAETSRVLAPDGRVSIYDKFISEGTEPSVLRRVLNPAARFLFSDLMYQLEPILSEAGLERVGSGQSALGGLYRIARARPIEMKDSRSSEPPIPSRVADTA